MIVEWNFVLMINIISVMAINIPNFALRYIIPADLDANLSFTTTNSSYHDNTITADCQNAIETLKFRDIIEAMDSSGHFPPESFGGGNFFALGLIDSCLGLKRSSTYCVASIDVSYVVFGSFYNSQVRTFKRSIPLFRSMPGIDYIHAYCLPSECGPTDAYILTQMAIDFIITNFSKTLTTFDEIGHDLDALHHSLIIDDVICSYKINNHILPISILDPNLNQSSISQFLANAEENRKADLNIGLIFFGIAFSLLILAHFVDKYNNSKALWVKIITCFSPTQNFAKITGTQPWKDCKGDSLNSVKHPPSISASESNAKSNGCPPNQSSSVTGVIKLGRERLAIFNGIRALVMLHVVFGHTYVFAIFYVRNLGDVLRNGAGSLAIPTHPLFLFLYFAFFAVDTFFFVSGYMAVVSTSTRCKQPNSSSAQKGRASRALAYVAYRLARLTPNYVALIAFSIWVGPYTGSGPFWPAPGLGGIDPTCKTHWWTNLLYTNNLIAVDKMCAPWTWYLANDVQFHLLLAPLLIVAYATCKTSGKAALPIWALLIANVAVSFAVSYAYDLNSFAFVEDTKVLSFFYDFYIKPYIRVGPFLIGLLLGCRHHYAKPNISTTVQAETPRYFKTKIVFSVFTSIILAVGVRHILTFITWDIMARSVLALINATYRPLWGLILYFFVDQTLRGEGKLTSAVRRFLSADFWVPISNLTYSAYLIHPIVLQIVFRSMRTSIYFTHTTLFAYFLEVTVITYAFSLLASLTFELPFINLARMAFRPKSLDPK